MSRARIVVAAIVVLALPLLAWLALDAGHAGADDAADLSSARERSAPSTMALDVPERADDGGRASLAPPARVAVPEPLALGDALELHVVVLDELGVPLPQARRVGLAWTDLKRPARVFELDERAGFTTSVPRAAELRLHAAAEGHLDVSARWTPPSGAEAWVELRLRRAGRVAGELRYDDGAVVPGAGVRVEVDARPPVAALREGAVALASALPSTLFARTDEQGRFAFSAPALDCRVVPLRAPASPPVFGSPDEAWTAQPTSVDAWAARAVGLVPVPGATTLCTLSVPRPPGLSGRVVRGGAGVEGVRVQVFPSGRDGVGASTVTRKGGEFGFGELVPGPVRVLSSSWNPETPLVRRVQDVVVPQQGSTWVEIDFSGTRVLLDPVDALGQPIGQVVFQARPLDGLPPGVELERSWSTGGRGWGNVLDPLPPGLYEFAAVEVFPEDFEALSAEGGEDDPDTAYAWVWDQDAYAELAARATGRRGAPRIVKVVADPPDGQQRVVFELR